MKLIINKFYKSINYIKFFRKQNPNLSIEDIKLKFNLSYTMDCGEFQGNILIKDLKNIADISILKEEENAVNQNILIKKQYLEARNWFSLLSDKHKQYVQILIENSMPHA